MDTQHRSRVTTGGRLWGPERVAAGISLDRLARQAHVSKGLISLMETGRMVPSGDEYRRITEALAALRQEMV